MNLYKKIQETFIICYILTIIMYTLKQGFEITTIIYSSIELAILLLVLFPFKKYINNIQISSNK